jgi:hypothetical protein
MDIVEEGGGGYDENPHPAHILSVFISLVATSPACLCCCKGKANRIAVIKSEEKEVVSTCRLRLILRDL